MDVKLILYAALVAVLGMMLAYMIIPSLSETKAKGKRKKVKSGPGHVAIDVKRSGDGVNISVYSVYDDREPDGPLFPDIVGDPNPDDGGLDRNFWERVATLDTITDPRERDEIVRTLVKRGFIKGSDMDRIAMPAPDLDEEDMAPPFPTDPAEADRRQEEPSEGTDYISDEDFANLVFNG